MPVGSSIRGLGKRTWPTSDAGAAPGRPGRHPEKRKLVSIGVAAPTDAPDAMLLTGTVQVAQRLLQAMPWGLGEPRLTGLRLGQVG
jgi:hypothetical protein